jgi:hypothetical protein
LQTEEVGIQTLEYIAEALALASPQSVYVPGNKFHIAKIIINV